MSLQFSNTTSKDGIIQTIERNCGFTDGFITGNTTLMAQFTADVNLALSAVIQTILKSCGTWQFDDTNFTDYPIISTNLVSGQRDYPFTTDGSGNLILEVQKVLVADQTGVFNEIDPVDVASQHETQDFTSGLNPTGVPTRYDKNANAVFLDPVPSYNSSNGLKIYISREGSFFTTSDTTKKPGFSGLFHELLAVIPAYKYAYRKKLDNVTDLEKEMLRLQAGLEEYYGGREKDVRKVIKGKTILHR